MHIRSKLITGYMISIFFLALIALMGVVTNRSFETAFTTLSNHTIPMIKALEDLRFAGLRIVSSTTEYALIVTQKKINKGAEGTDKEEEEENLIAEGKNNFTKALILLENLRTKTNLPDRDLIKIKKTGTALLKTSAILLQAVENISTENILETKKVFEKEERKLLKIIDQLLIDETLELSYKTDIIHSKIKMAETTTILAGFLAMVISIGIAFRVSHSISNPLSKLTKAAQGLASGDLTTHVEFKSTDEFGILSHMFNYMTDEIDKTTVSKNFLDQIITAMTDVLIVVDKEGNVKTVNQAAKNLLGYEKDQLLGMNINQLILDENQRYTLSKSQWMASGILTGTSEKLLVAKDNTTIPISLSGAQMKNNKNQLSGTVFVARDITKNKQAEQELITAKKQAETATLAKSKFLANMSHEIRTPLNAVLGNAELLIGTQLTENQTAFVRTILFSGEGLLRIINDILDSSKIEAGHLTIENNPFDLRIMIENLAHLFAEQAQKKGLELVCDLPPEGALGVRGDSVRLRQVLSNLIENAIKFTKEGEVSIKIRQIKDSSLLRFEIKDTGLGIQLEAHQRVFQAFTQEDESTTKNFGGTGLGLSVSNKLVRLMGGTIGLDSNPGEGSTFWFTSHLPSVWIESAQPSASAKLATKKILVIDDNKTNRNVLSNQLKAWEIDHDCAENAIKALEKLKSAAVQDSPFNVALLDMHMPGLNGIELTKTIRFLSEGATLHVIIMIPVLDKPEKYTVEEVGIIHYLQKPLRQADLYETLTMVTGQKPFSIKPVSINPAQSKKLFPFHALVVDDNAINRQLVQDMLKSIQCDTDTAEEGLTAYRLLTEREYDIVFMDCQMPKMDGFRAVREIRDREQANKKKKRIPIIALTANAMEGDHNRCLAAGMDDYIVKPFSIKKLSDALQRWVKEKKRFTECRE